MSTTTSGVTAAAFKLSGAGNDFLALVNPASSPTSEQIRAWCHRALSLGADGLFQITRTVNGARMVHHNADGGRSTLCLNGSRCAAQLAFHLGWAEGALVLETDAGALQVHRIDDGQVCLALPPIVGTPELRTLHTEHTAHQAWWLQVGVPHLVVPWDSGLDGAPVATLGAALRAHPGAGPAGANVNFVRMPAADRLEIRTFERGVEAETLACGTGVVAAVACGVATGRLRPPVRAQTLGGFVLEVACDPPAEAGGAPVYRLSGDARVLARLELFDGARRVPSPMPWR